MDSEPFALSDAEFKRRFRLSKDTVRMLCDELDASIGPQDSGELSTETKLLCALKFFATGSFQSVVDNEETPGTSQSCESNVHSVASALTEVATTKGWVHFPSTHEKAAIKREFLRRWKIPGILGCVDSTLVAITKPENMSEEYAQAFWCRKGYYALKVMIVCDANMKILVVGNCTGSCHDADMWRSHFRRRLVSQRVGPGEFFLGDSGFPLEPWLMTPIADHPGPQTPEGKYNAAHASARSVVDRCIGLLKNRFRCLQQPRALPCEPGLATYIIGACCALYNLCLLEDDDSSRNSDDDGDEDSDTDDVAKPDPALHERILRLDGIGVQSRILARFSVSRSRHTAYLQRVRRRILRQLRQH